MSGEALARLGAWPRRLLGRYPTPLVRAPRLAAELAAPAPDLWLKLDAETGFALGGNKVRKLELELAPERVEGVDVLLTAGGPQSNHCRVTAAAAARLGLRCVLVLNGPEPDPPRGNALLHRLFGAEIHTVSSRDERTSIMDALARELERGGARAHVVPIGASTGLGCLGYALAAVELTHQLDALEPAPERTVLFVPTSSCGTLAGLLLGLAVLGRDDIPLVGVSADLGGDELVDRTFEIAREGAALLGWEGVLPVESIVAVDDQVGEGYGVPTPASREATELFGTTEGVVLDPTYTSKGAAAMIAWVRSGRLGGEDRVVFVHTGGHPALLAGG